MENIRNMFKWGLMILIAVLFLTPQVSHAAGNKISSDQCQSPIYDLTGTYDMEIFDCDFTLTLFQDGKGKLSGDGISSCSAIIDLDDDDYRNVDFNFTYVAKGAVKSNHQFSFSIKLKGTAHIDGLGSTQFSATQSFKAQIEEGQGGPIMSGKGKAKACIKKIGCDSETFYFEEQLEDPDNGTWGLTFDSDTGEGELELLFNGRTFPFSAKEKLNIKKGESTFSLKGIETSSIESSAKGCSLKGKFDGDDKLISLKGKVLGQKINCQQHNRPRGETKIKQ